MSSQFEAFKKQITNPVKFRLFMLRKLPSAWFAGLKIESLTQEKAVISVKYSWFNQNPFRSVYVGILSMASEVSTGILCMGALYNRKPAVSMLVVKNEGHYYKKATGRILFTCKDGMAINATVERAIETGESTSINCHTVGTNAVGETVAEFYFTWSFKVRQH
ncbi:MAG TPA: DUF4442 domain-containing protein [Segetibacter sp.]